MLVNRLLTDCGAIRNEGEAMDNQAIPTDASTELLRSGKWLCFTRDMQAEQAARRFMERYGRQPDYLIDHLNILWAGLVPERAISP